MNEYERVSFIFQTQGVAGIEAVLRMGLNDNDYVQTSSAYGITNRMLPLYVAVELQFAAQGIAQIMTAMNLSIREVNSDFLINANEPITRDDGSVFDGITVLRSIAEAYLLQQHGSALAIKELQRWITHSPDNSYFKLAALALGHPDLVLKPAMDAQIVAIANGETPVLQHTLHHQIGYLAMMTQEARHLPNHSPADYLRSVDAFHGGVVNKRTGGGFFWERIFLGAPNDTAKQKIVEHVLKREGLHTPSKVKGVLMSLDFGSVNWQVDDNQLTEAVEYLVDDLQKSTLKSILNEEAFQLSMLPTLPDRFDFSDVSNIAATFTESQMLADFFQNLFEAGDKLFEKLMLSQMHEPFYSASMNQYMVWKKISTSIFPAQVIDPEVANRYLNRMVEHFQRYKIHGADNHTELVEHYDAIGRSMRVLQPHIESVVDYDALRVLKAPYRNDLALWGFDIDKLEISSEKTVEKRLFIDLGL
jgi:hypothetical protein